MKRHIIPIATMLLLAAVSRAQTADVQPSAANEADAPAASQEASATDAPEASQSPEAPNPALAAAVAAAAANPGTNTVRENTVRYRDFQVIVDRNIFNANRTGRISRNGGGTRVRPTQVDTFALLGTMSYEKGRFAFFGGSSPTYRKTLKPTDKIAGYTVADVSHDRVKLATTNGEPLELCIGMQMRRVDGGPWSMSGRTETASSSAESAATAAVLSAADDSADIEESPDDDDTTKALKRLMKKRKKELSK